MNILPRFGILHTSETQLGQIYIPRVTWILAIGVMLLVLGFEKSGNLASAYGISVTGEMVVTNILLFIVMLRIWRWRLAAAIGIISFFLVIDVSFLSANVLKVVEGGWVSLGIAFIMSIIMWTWIRGSRYLFDKTRKSEVPLDVIVKEMARKPPTIVPGTAVFLTGDPDSTPTALMHSLKHYKVLHETNAILTIVTAPTPRVPERERVEIEEINELFKRVKITFGYMEQPNLPRALALCRKQGWKFDIMTTSFFLSRRSLKASKRSGMPLWQDRLFIALARNAADATQYFQIPTGRVVEIGTQVVV
jgi:KUP system potassium uptake protein